MGIPILMNTVAFGRSVNPNKNSFYYSFIADYIIVVGTNGLR